MIRILQQNNKATKALFAVIIGFAIISMVIYLVPGIADGLGGNSNDPNVYATVHEPGFFGKLFGTTVPVTRPEISRVIQQQTQGRPVPPYILPYFESQAGQQLIQLAILKIEGDRRGLQVTDDDLRKILHEGQLGQILFPDGKYIGDDKYVDFVQSINYTRPDFEAQLKKEIEQGRLQSLITGGVTVSDNEVRDSYRISGTKVKFDYAVISSDEIAKTLNPSDSDLQAFFKQNAPRYATAVDETRKLQYISFGADQVPGGKPQLSDAEIQAYYEGHLKSYTTEESVKARHILISVPQGADAKTDAAAKAKAEDLLKQIKAGGDFAKLAAANSDDPGSKGTGGELGTFTRGKMVPEFEKAAFAQQPGQTSDPVKTSFGYHLIQTEEKTPAHTKTLAEVKPEILPILLQQKMGSAEQNFANQLVTEARKDGIEKTAAAHNLRVVTTDYLPKTGTIAGVSDGTSMLSQAFATTKGAPPAAASTGDGFAVFQVVDVKAPHAPTFDEYKSHLLADYRDQQVPQMLNARLAKLASRAKELNDLQKAAAELNLTVKSSDLVGKEGQVPDLGSMAGSAAIAFSLPKGGISGPLNNGATGAVLEVTDKQEPTAEDIAKNFSETRDKMLNTKKQDAFNIYLGTLADKYKKAGAIKMRVQPATPGGPLGT